MAQQTRGLSVLTKVILFNSSFYTNLDQISASESQPSINFTISVEHQHQNIDQSLASKSRSSTLPYKSSSNLLLKV